jgi:hypothetical protein
VADDGRFLLILQVLDLRGLRIVEMAAWEEPEHVVEGVDAHLGESADGGALSEFQLAERSVRGGGHRRRGRRRGTR